MKVLKSFLLILIGLVALILVIALFLPKEVKIVSETEINLPVNKVFYSLATFSDHASWDPWIGDDSTVQTEITRVDGYVGTKYSWKGEKTGSGELVIDSLTLNKYLYFTLSIGEMSQKPLVWNDLEEKDGKTLLKWGFSQDASYPAGRIFMAIMKNKLVSDYNRGLANLKSLLEEKGVMMSSLTDMAIKDIPGFAALVVPGRASMAELDSMLPSIFGNILKISGEEGLEISGLPFVHYLGYDEATDMSDFEAGYPVNKTGKAKPGIKSIIVPTFSALTALHKGPYDELDNSYGIMMQYITEQNITAANEAWEFYQTDPELVPDEMEWRTVIAFPLK